MFPKKDKDGNQKLLERKADLNARLKLIPYEGTPEIKEVNCNKYIYVLKRIRSRVKSTYLGSYTDALYDNAQRWNMDSRSLKKEIRNIEKQLAKVYIVKDDKPRCLLIDLEVEPELKMTDEEKVQFIGRRILKEHKRAFEELAK